MTSRTSVLAAFAVILLDLAWRAGLDKVLALSGTPALVGLWAQLQSVVDLVSGVVVAGIAQGLTVLIAQARGRQEEAGLLRAALKLGTAVALMVAALFLMFMPWLQPWLTQGKLGFDVLALAALAGCIAIFPGLMSAYWLGRHQQHRVLQFALLATLPCPGWPWRAACIWDWGCAGWQRCCAQCCCWWRCPWAGICAAAPDRPRMPRRGKS